jgi:hypothetical protein
MDTPVFMKESPATIFTVMNPARKIVILVEMHESELQEHLHSKGITIRTGH